MVLCWCYEWEPSSHSPCTMRNKHLGMGLRSSLGVLTLPWGKGWLYFLQHYLYLPFTPNCLCWTSGWCCLEMRLVPTDFKHLQQSQPLHTWVQRWCLIDKICLQRISDLETLQFRVLRVTDVSGRILLNRSPEQFLVQRFKCGFSFYYLYDILCWSLNEPVALCVPGIQARVISSINLPLFH